MTNPKTYSILLVVKKADTNTYTGCASRLEALASRTPTVQILGENTLLIPLNEGLTALYDVLYTIDNLSYTYTILTQDTEWHEGTKGSGGS